MSTLTRDQFNELRYDFYHKVRADYSGRGMYGDTCLAYTGNNVALFLFDLARLLTGETDPDAHTLRSELERIGTGWSDSLGLGTVHYWQGIDVEPGDDDDEDEDDEDDEDW
jgi:hypothetical protein